MVSQTSCSLGRDVAYGNVGIGVASDEYISRGFHWVATLAGGKFKEWFGVPETCRTTRPQRRLVTYFQDLSKYQESSSLELRAILASTPH